MIMTETSRACSYLLQNLVELFISWMRVDFQPRQCVVFVTVEDVAERFHTVPTSVFLVVGGNCNMRPAVHISHQLES